MTPELDLGLDSGSLVAPVAEEVVEVLTMSRPLHHSLASPAYQACACSVGIAMAIGGLPCHPWMGPEYPPTNLMALVVVVALVGESGLGQLEPPQPPVLVAWAQWAQPQPPAVVEWAYWAQGRPVVIQQPRARAAQAQAALVEQQLGPAREPQALEALVDVEQATPKKDLSELARVSQALAALEGQSQRGLPSPPAMEVLEEPPEAGFPQLASPTPAKSAPEPHLVSCPMPAKNAPEPPPPLALVALAGDSLLIPQLLASLSTPP